MFLQNSLFIILSFFGVNQDPALEQARSIEIIVDEIREHVDSKKFGQAESAIDEIAAIEGVESVKALLYCMNNYFYDSKLYRKSMALLRKKKASPKYFYELVQHGDAVKWTYKILIADACREIYDESEQALEVLISLAMIEKHKSVRRVAIVGLGHSKSARAVNLLIDLFESTGKSRLKRLQGVCADSLWKLTELEFSSAAQWREWWSLNQMTFQPKKQVTKTLRPSLRRPWSYNKLPKARKVLIIIDNSITMNSCMKTDMLTFPDKSGPNWSDWKFIAGMSRENIKLAKFWTRKAMIEREVSFLLSSFHGNTRYKISVLIDKESKKTKSLRIPLAKAKKQSLDYVRGLKFDNGYSTIENLKKTIKENLRVHPDFEIYFLTDGQFTKSNGSAYHKKLLLASIFSGKFASEFTVHTIGLKPSSNSNNGPILDLADSNKFLKRLAELSGGSFTELEVDLRRSPDNPNPPEVIQEKRKRLNEK